ncbi:hypothetical protein GYMLUDRAFT_249407 [Collybiopsis luxurians FD-317 M1]|uniref:Uncharacterized protein n=1 Tax=Collybiopsis luxurians FD-317 M1 TaxID=944289 RepID=A0A0D0BI71_9AGAR|nr:hypothetical protein GYMLUDRAFT_249407 [Collybiopsis luxurians FD-317 M1]
MRLISTFLLIFALVSTIFAAPAINTDNHETPSHPLEARAEKIRIKFYDDHGEDNISSRVQAITACGELLEAAKQTLGLSNDWKSSGGIEFVNTYREKNAFLFRIQITGAPKYPGKTLEGKAAVTKSGWIYLDEKGDEIFWQDPKVICSLLSQGKLITLVVGIQSRAAKKWKKEKEKEKKKEKGKKET